MARSASKPKAAAASAAPSRQAGPRLARVKLAPPPPEDVRACADTIAAMLLRAVLEEASLPPAPDDDENER